MNIRSAAPVVRRPDAAPVAKAAAVAPAANAAPVAKPVAKAAVVKPEATEWTAGRIAKTAGVGVGAFVAGNVGTFVADLFFHFGNNGGTAFAGGIYTAIALTAAVGGMALYNHLKSNDK